MKMGDNLYCQAPQKDRGGIKLIKVVLYFKSIIYSVKEDLNIAHQDNFMVIFGLV